MHDKSPYLTAKTAIVAVTGCRIERFRLKFVRLREQFGGLLRGNTVACRLAAIAWRIWRGNASFYPTNRREMVPWTSKHTTEE